MAQPGLVFESAAQSYLNISGQWEIATLRMALEPVIGQNSPQIRVIGEEHAVHVVDLALIPIGPLEHLAGRVDRRQFVGVGFDANPRVEAQRQQIIDDLDGKRE